MAATLPPPKKTPAGVLSCGWCRDKIKTIMHKSKRKVFGGKGVLLNVIWRRLRVIYGHEGWGSGWPDINVINMLISSSFLARVYDALRMDCGSNNTRCTKFFGSLTRARPVCLSVSLSAAQQQRQRQYTTIQ